VTGVPALVPDALDETVVPGRGGEADAGPAPGPDRDRLWDRFWIVCGALLLLMGVLVALAIVRYEALTSALQSWLFSRHASELTYEVGPGPSPRIVFPEDGPLDRRRGYIRLPEMQDRLVRRGFRVTEQARFSPALARHVERGMDPPEWLPDRSGLVVRGKEGETLYEAADRTFAEAGDVPELVREALLFIEDRELAKLDRPWRNPAINWSRFMRAGLLLAAGQLGLEVPSEGGSTLATQMEKFRHSPEGRTESPPEKLRQMLDASLKAYQDGRDTRDERRAIVAHYLNSMPLSAVPGYGEVYGLGPGLWAWFGLDLGEVVRALEEGGDAAARVSAFKHVLALICAVREPSRMLLADRAALAARADAYAALMAREGPLDPAFARRVQEQPLVFDHHPPAERLRSSGHRKAVDGVRRALLGTLEVDGFYELGRLDLDVATTIDAGLQGEVSRLLDRLDDRAFIVEHGLREERLLAHGDPSRILYSVLLYERTEEGNLLRVQADSLDAPFDLNEDVKLELGSTAKLRTLAHYLELVARLHRRLAPLDGRERWRVAREAGDPITLWAAARLGGGVSLPALLEAAMDRTYSASPAEAFFTGGGVHHFHNFDSRDDARVLTVREATARSVNLVFIRLMRDLVAFQEARLPYDAGAVLAEDDHPDRRRLLERSVEEEDRLLLFRAWERFRGKEGRPLLEALLGSGAGSARQLAILYFAWHQAGPKDVASLREWLERSGAPVDARRAERLFDAYDNPRLTLADYAYLLRRRPMDVWAAGQIRSEPGLGWDALWSGSAAAREVASAWLFQPRNRSAQQRRLRVQIERDAFAAMTPDWQRLGFPFERLVPSLATSIGSSSDRPAALAQLMGIIVGGGQRLPAVRVEDLGFARETAYHTVLDRMAPSPQPVMEPEVARTLQRVLARVVEGGTARRAYGAIERPDGTEVVIGGKTGSGDNRLRRFARGGRLVSSQVVNRTATFVFYIGERHFGVITAFVDGPEAGRYRFTSSLPVKVLQLLGPTLSRVIESSTPSAPDPPPAG
jgi:membrane peptidoglycan carboxypeptidase